MTKIEGGSRTVKKKLNLAPVYFLTPHIILFLVFILLPSIYGIYASFTKWNLINDPYWVGLDNYKTILFDQDSTFHRQFFNGMKNTLIFVGISRSEEHTSELQSRFDLVCRLLLEKKNNIKKMIRHKHRKHCNCPPHHYY